MLNARGDSPRVSRELVRLYRWSSFGRRWFKSASRNNPCASLWSNLGSCLSKLTRLPTRTRPLVCSNLKKYRAPPSLSMKPKPSQRTFTNPIMIEVSLAAKAEQKKQKPAKKSEDSRSLAPIDVVDEDHAEIVVEIFKGRPQGR